VFAEFRYLCVMDRSQERQRQSDLTLAHLHKIAKAAAKAVWAAWKTPDVAVNVYVKDLYELELMFCAVEDSLALAKRVDPDKSVEKLVDDTVKIPGALAVLECNNGSAVVFYKETQ